MIPIPEELLEQIERGNVLLFIGERIVRDAAGLAVLDQLTAQLAARCGITDTEDLAFPEVAQAYEDDKGRQALVQFMRDQLEALGDQPQQAHRVIAGLTDCNVLATTCLDRRLERAFEEAKRPLDVIIGNLDVAFEDEHKAQLYKLRGSVERAESLVLTEDDYETFFEDQASISVVLQGYLARKTILFIGYDLADPHFKRLYRKVTAPLDDFARRAYAFGEAPSPRVCRWCERHGIEVVEADATAFLEALTKQLAARTRPAPAVPPRPVEEPAAPLPERPYKLLDYYETKDETIFFGRQQETQTLTSLIHAHRLVLLYGASGVGKTSLLLAGAIPRLESTEPPYETIYVRALEDPALVIRRTVRRRLAEADLPEDSSLVDFLDAATKALGCTLVIILDQFEEFFIRLSPQFRAALIAELGALYDARDVPIKVVLSLREDWLASVSEIEERIPEVFRTKMRLLPLTRDQARQAITAPVERLGVSYEPALVEQLLDDLAGSEGATVMPPQLQLVCSALYGGLEPDERLITLTVYEWLGGARGVLQKCLDDELARLGSDERALARGVLQELVTSQGTKAVKAGDELALALDMDLSDVEPVLEKLVRARLLRVLEREDGGTAYELAHEYLIREIGLGAEAQARKQAEELIKQEVENWQRFGTLLAADKLALVGEVREVLRLNAEAQELLLRSALQVGHEVDYWLGRVSDPGQRVAVLAEAARSQLAVVRRRAAEALGTQDVPESAEPLLGLAVRDADPSVRAAARMGLAKLTVQHPTAMARLRSETKSEDRTVRRAALETLAALPLRGLPAGLRVQVLTTRIRLHAAWLVERSLATPMRRAVALTVGLLLVLMALAYIFSASCYYVDTRPSPIPGESNAVVIRRGHPLLKLPGLGREAVDTGINLIQVAKDHWTDVNSGRLWGLWVQRSGTGFQKWGQDVSTALRLENGILVLWYLDRDEGLRAVLEATDSQDPESRRGGARGLGRMVAANRELATPKVAKALLGLLTDEDSNVRSSAAYALGQVVEANSELTTPKVAEALLELLTDKDSNVRSSAAYALGQVVETNLELATPKVAEALLGLLTDEDSNVRSSAANALGQVVEANPELAPQVAEAMLGLLTAKDWNVRVSAVEALRPVVEDNPEVATPQVAEAMLGLLTAKDLNVRYNRAVYVLGPVVAANPEVATLQVAEALLGLLTDEDKFVRANAAYVLGQVVEANPEVATLQVAEAMFGLLTSENSSVRSSAAYVLGQVGAANSELAPQMAETLVWLLTNEDKFVRANAAYALGQVVEANPELAPQMAEALLGLLTDEDSNVRSRAAYVLGQVGAANSELAPQMAETLVWLLTDKDSNVRSSAAYALGQVGAANSELAPQMAEALLGLLTDKDSNVRSSAAYALGQVVEANPELAPQVAEALLGLLTDKDSNVRSSAAYALGQVVEDNPEVASPQVAEALVGLLTDENSEVRRRTAGALGQVYAHQVLQPGGTDELLFTKLTDPLNALERPIVARALFLVVLRDPTRSQTIRRRLRELSTSHEPIARIWANATLQMANLTDLAHTVIADPSQREDITGKLERLGKTYIFGEYFTFFGEDFSWAAQEALDWLEQQATEGD